jgi:hypothetical protein
MDVTAGRRELDRVGQEVEHDLAQLLVRPRDLVGEASSRASHPGSPDPRAS